MRAPLLPVSLAGLLACDAPRAGRSGETLSTAASEWRFAETPRLSIGSADGDERYLLTGVDSGILLRDGRIVVGELAGRMRVYGPDGEHIADWGRRGEGPGEFALLRGIEAYRGDSLAVYDFVHSRLTVLDDQGQFARTVRVALTMPPWEQMGRGTVPASDCCTFVGTLPDGSFVFKLPDVIPVGGTGNRWSHATLVRLSATGEAIDTLAHGPSAEYAPDASHPYGVRRMHHTGRFQAVVAGDRVYFGNGVDYDIEVRSAGGEALPSLRREHARVPVTPELRRAEEEELTRRFAAAPETLERLLATRAQSQWADHLPAWTFLIPDPEGNLWVLETAVPGGEAARFTVFGPDGTAIAHVPDGLYPLYVGGGSLLTVAVDDFGVQSVRVHDVLR